MTAKILKSKIAGIHDFPATVAAHAVEMRDWRAHMARVKEDETNGVVGIDKHMPHPRPSSHPIVESAVNENNEADFEIVDDGPTPEMVLSAKKTTLMIAVDQAEQRAIAATSPFGKRRLFNIRESKIRAADVEIIKATHLKNAEIAAGNARIADANASAADKAAEANRVGEEAVKVATEAEAARVAKEDAAVSAWRAISDKVGLTKPERSTPIPIPEFAPIPIPAPDPLLDSLDVAEAVNANRTEEDQNHLAFMKKSRVRLSAIELAAAQAHSDIEDLTLETIDAWKLPTF